MGLFGKKKEEKSCCCGDSCTPEKMAQAEATKTTAGVKVLGSGYAKCHALEDATRAALAELNMDTTIDHVTDFSQIARGQSPHSEGQGIAHEPKAKSGVYLRPQLLPEPNCRGPWKVPGLRCI